MPLNAGQILQSRYRIASPLGKGGMGAVYRAWDLSLDRPVAVKVNESYEKGSQGQFEREAKILARLRHANLPAILDHFVTQDGKQCLVMEFIEGEDLDHMIKAHSYVDEERALAWIDKVCDAVAYLHAQTPPIVHRDIKPANIKITPQGEVFLVDFGLAKVGDAEVMTSTGARGVTPGFSPPEQYGAGGTDARSDVYALGATLYALLTGTTPAESVLRTIGAVELIAPQELRPDTPDHVASAVEAALQTAPSNRPETVEAFRAMLQPSGRTTLRPEPTAILSATDHAGTPPFRLRQTIGQLSPPVKIAGLTVLVLGIAGVVAVSVWGGPGFRDPIPTATIASITSPVPTRTRAPSEEPASRVTSTSVVALAGLATDTPQPSLRMSPTSTVPSVDPTETAIPTVAPSETSTSAPTVAPTQRCPGVAQSFVRAWKETDGQIGCNTSRPWVTEIAEQLFEGGWMYWRKDIDRIYVVFGNGTWRQYEHSWTTDNDAFSCPDDNTPAQNPPTPIMGFGEVWCTQSGVRSSLGKATRAEVYYDATLQTFELGHMMETKSGIWSFYNNGRWERR
ncbi:MAG: serine/threonine protein kinase [Anaerolineae bacterium]